MRFCSFASGSSGNCALVSCADVNILIDAGISMRRISAALGRYGLGFGDLDGILVTHEHADHIAGLRMIAKYHAVPVYAPSTVARRLSGAVPGIEDCLRSVEKGSAFFLKDLSVLAFATSHDIRSLVFFPTK